GANYWGQLGNDNVPNATPFPVLVHLPAGVVATAIAAGGYEHSLAITSTGDVLGWGHDRDGELGDGTFGTAGCDCRAVPVAVNLPAGVTATAIAAGTYHG